MAVDKTTYPKLLGLERSKEVARELVAEAKAAIACYGATRSAQTRRSHRNFSHAQRCCVVLRLPPHALEFGFAPNMAGEAAAPLNGLADYIIARKS